MERCPHCQEDSFSSLRHDWFGRPGSVHRCPSCGGKAGLPATPIVLLMSLTVTPLVLLRADLAEPLVAVLAMLPSLFAVWMWWRGAYALVPVAEDISALPRAPFARQWLPAALSASAIVLFACAAQWTIYVLAVPTPEDWIRYGRPEVRPPYAAAVDWGLEQRFGLTHLDPATWTVDRAERYLTLAVKSDNLTAVRALARPGTAVDAPDARGRTPIAIALEGRHFAIADALAAAGADCDQDELLVHYGQAFPFDEERYMLQFAWLIEHGAKLTAARSAAIFADGGRFQKALLASLDAPIPAEHAAEAAGLRHWMLSGIDDGREDSAKTQDVIHRPFTALRRAWGEAG